jgi:class 3 adenylate cyclase
VTHTDQDPIHGARSGTVGTAPASQGIEIPHELASTPRLVDRSFSFVDLCGFTHFTSERGEQAAVDELQAFRALIRAIAMRRGVLVNKWLGDGALFVSAHIGATVAATAELIARHQDQPLPIRAGIAHGQVLIIDGDDYVGRPANLAARLCELAGPGEVLAANLASNALPAWTRVVGTRHVSIRGIGPVPHVQEIALTSDVELPPLTGV